MVGPIEERVTLAQAAELVGKHPNTIRKYIKAGKVPGAQKVLSDFGETYMLPRAAVLSLRESPSLTPLPDTPVIAPAEHGALAPADLAPLLERVTAPLLERLERQAEELGQARAQISQLEEQAAALRRRPWWRRVIG